MVLAEELIRALGDQTGAPGGRTEEKSQKGSGLSVGNNSVPGNRSVRMKHTAEELSKEIRKTHLLELQKGERSALTVRVEEPVACRMKRL